MVIPGASRRTVKKYKVDFDRAGSFVFKCLEANDAVLDVRCGAGEMYQRLRSYFQGSYTVVNKWAYRTFVVANKGH